MGFAFPPSAPPLPERRASAADIAAELHKLQRQDSAASGKALTASGGSSGGSSGGGCEGNGGKLTKQALSVMDALYGYRLDFDGTGGVPEEVEKLITSKKKPGDRSLLASFLGKHGSGKAGRSTEEAAKQVLAVLKAI